jgi:uncharacterized protein (TIGR02171 family)
MLRYFILSAMIFSCSFIGPEGEDHKFEHPDNFAYVSAEGKKFTMGRNDSLSPNEQRPAFEHRFDYDFAIMKTPVTQKSFFSLMKRLNQFSDSLNPVVAVTWYDAILYANELSKSLGYDTVYSYLGTRSNSNGSVIEMEALEIHFQKKGFRLPTEAEWEYVASEGGKNHFPWPDGSNFSDYVWLSQNSGSKLKRVARLKANAFGVYDMGGNVMEWISDWKGPFDSIPKNNFVGFIRPNFYQEKPLKGASFQHSPIRVSNRSDAYPAMPAVSNHYVGFRLVLGEISKESYGDAKGGVSTRPLRLKHSFQEYRNFLGQSNAKLVFVNRITGNAAFVDFSRADEGLLEIDDSISVAHPEISPDGRYIAFSDKAEGIIGDCAIYARDLNAIGLNRHRVTNNGCIPRWWKDSETRKNYLIFPESASPNSDPEWLSRSTFKQAMLGNFPIGMADNLALGGEFNGGFSQDLSFFASGYTRLKVWNHGESKVLFSSPENGKGPDGSNQVCNVSVSPDNHKQLLFIDFGYSGKSTLIDSSYGIHEYLFISGPDGIPHTWIAPPEGDVGWDFPEWSNHPDFITAVSSDAQGDPRKVWIINVKTKEKILVVEGDVLWMPKLWMAQNLDENQQLNLDSLGWYSWPGGVLSTPELSQRMISFWAQRSIIEGVVLGTSRYAGIYVEHFDQPNFFNFSIPGSEIQTYTQMLDDYILSHTPNLKTLILALDIDMFVFSLETHKYITSNIGYIYDKNNHFWVQNTPKYIDEMIAAAPKFYNNHYQNVISIFGTSTQLGDGTGTWGELKINGENWDMATPEFIANWKSLESLLTKMELKGIRVVGMLSPMDPDYIGKNRYGRYGPKLDEARKIFQKMKDLELKYPGFKLFDVHKFGEHDYDGSHALDSDHLNRYGIMKLTWELNDFLNMLDVEN